MANLLTTDTELTQVANAIRGVTGGASALSYPDGFSSALSGVTRQGATTYNTSTSDQTITARKLITGTQTIKGVSTSNIDAGNIKKGVVVKVGDANNAGRIKNVTGTFTGDANAAAGDIRNGKTAYVNGNKVTGNMTEKAAATYNVSSSDQTIAASQYLAGAQTIRKVTTSNISAGNIKAGVTVKVGDAADDDRIAGVTGTFTSDANAAAGDIRSGKTAYVNGSKVTGNWTPAVAVESRKTETYTRTSTDTPTYTVYPGMAMLITSASIPSGYSLVEEGMLWEIEGITNSDYLKLGYAIRNNTIYTYACNMGDSYCIPSTSYWKLTAKITYVKYRAV